jgi:Flp pilus assembly protein TadG
MMASSWIRPSDRQRGAAAVEFAIVAMVFFLILLGILEFGRLLYLWNTTQEVTRRAARTAVVNWMSDAAAIQREAIFRGGSSGTVSLPAGPELNNAAVTIRYLSAYDPTTGVTTEVNPPPNNASDNITACLDIARSNSCIRYVEASVSGVNYQPMAGLFAWLSIPLPISTVIMPAESMGYRP